MSCPRVWLIPMSDESQYIGNWYKRMDDAIVLITETFKPIQWGKVCFKIIKAEMRYGKYPMIFQTSIVVDKFITELNAGIYHQIDNDDGLTSFGDYIQKLRD